MGPFSSVMRWRLSATAGHTCRSSRRRVPARLRWSHSVLPNSSLAVPTRQVVLAGLIPLGRGMSAKARLSGPARSLVSLLAEHKDGLALAQLVDHARARFRGVYQTRMAALVR